MSKIFIKKAFTMAELFVSLLVMAIIAYCAISYVFMNAKSTKKAEANLNNYLICYEGKSDVMHGGKFDPAIQGCNFEVTPDIASSEFFEIKLIGGGGGASMVQNGGTAEERTIHYPSLAFPFAYKKPELACNSPLCASCNTVGKCTSCLNGYKLDPKTQTCKINFYYRAYLGHGGATGQNGGQTSLLVIDKTTGNILKILETASGGITSNSVESTGASIMNVTSSELGSGNGGLSPNGHGQSGEVRIQW